MVQSHVLDPLTADPTALAVPLNDKVPNVRWDQAEAFELQFGAGFSIHTPTLGEP